MYCVKLKDVYGHDVIIEVSSPVYRLFEEERKAKERERYERRRHLDARSLDELAAAGALPASLDLEEWIIHRDFLSKVFATVNSCTPLQQERFYLHFLYGLTYAQIARLQGRSSDTVEKSISSVLKKIKKLF